VRRRARGSARAQGDHHGQWRGWPRQGRRGGDRGGSRVDAMGGGEHGARSRLTKVRVGFAGGKAHSAAKDMVPLPFPSAIVHEAPGHGEATVSLTRRQRPTRDERGQGPTLPPVSTRTRAGVHGGAGRQVREAMRARMRARTARRGAADASSKARRSTAIRGG
jgi:hypothetical protein